MKSISDSDLVDEIFKFKISYENDLVFKKLKQQSEQIESIPLDDIKYYIKGLKIIQNIQRIYLSNNIEYILEKVKHFK
jgi:hypothetical protein